MMIQQFTCQKDGRRRAVAEQSAINGIDYLEVSSADQKTLTLYFLHNLPTQTNPVPADPLLVPTVTNVVIEGGVRVGGIAVETVTVTDNYLEITVNSAGDFSTYTLKLVTSPVDETPPPGFDPQLSAIDFSFKVDCPSEFDCLEEKPCPPDAPQEPEINYLAKDYASFRRLMLDRLSLIMPEWQERRAADMQVALLELLAYAGDHLSYYQDAVGTEAYLGTARRRVSIRRHARLLDYAMHDGCNARTFAFLEVNPAGGAEGQILPGGTMLLSKGTNDTVVVDPAQLDRELVGNPVVFETMHPLTLRSAHNQISFYTWNDTECCLPRGATRATLLNDPTLSLSAGDLLLFEEVLSPTTGSAADANTARRHVVRLKSVTPATDLLDGTDVLQIEWFEGDALPFPICVSAEVATPEAASEVLEIAIARGNIVLAQHGMTVSGETPQPATVPAEGPYRPMLPQAEISFGVPYEDLTARGLPATHALWQEVRSALPQVSLFDEEDTWIPQRDLLNSDRFAREFVVEMDRYRRGTLRFGDDVHGRAPVVNTSFSAVFRIGNGQAGNIGAEALARIVTSLDGIDRVRNPLPGSGGTDAESMESVRQYAPQAFRTQERAVTEADYARMAERHPEVQKAAARFRWTGSWYTVFLTIDRKNGLPIGGDPQFVQDMLAHMERFRMAGYDLEIRSPRFVPLDIALTVCVREGYFRSTIQRRLLGLLSSYDLPDGLRGFFHPDNFTFGQPLYLSRLYHAAMGVEGVQDMEVTRFKRWAKIAGTELDDGVLPVADLEILRLDNDVNFPENGRIEFEMQGGL